MPNERAVDEPLIYQLDGGKSNIAPIICQSVRAQGGHAADGCASGVFYHADTNQRRTQRRLTEREFGIYCWMTKGMLRPVKGS